MATFTKKRGEVGWPNPQANQIEKWAAKFEIDAERHTAQTGTIYLTLTAKNGETITVRCADHADAHCTANFTVDPAIDQRAAVKAWIAQNGDNSAATDTASIKRRCTALLKTAPFISVGEDSAPEPSAWYRPTGGVGWTKAEIRDAWTRFEQALKTRGMSAEAAVPGIREYLTTNPFNRVMARALEIALDMTGEK